MGRGIVSKYVKILVVLILSLLVSGCDDIAFRNLLERLAAGETGTEGGVIDLPKTGQTTIYATGDDGDLKKGVAWPDPRFSDDLDGTITDNLTGLMWEQAPIITTRTWTQALSYCNELELPLGGYSDWRLPNRKELRSLVNYGVSDSADWLNLPAQGFSNVQADFYWSSTTFAPFTTEAWHVSLNDGRVYSYDKELNVYVLAVRAGQ